MSSFSKDFFPSKWGAVTFFAYMALFISQGILVTASKQKDSKYNYSTVTVVMLTECLKLLITSLIYIREYSFFNLLQAISHHFKVLILYFVPAFLYSLYNNLTFVNLSFFDPTTYFLLLQFRVVVTGIIFQIIFKKQLSRKQWLSLALLTFGCIVKELNISSPTNKESKISAFSPDLYFHILLILIQVFCSCFAGVYNEYLLKDIGAEVHLMLQNVFMYINSIICNIIVLILNGETYTAFSTESLHSILKPLIIIIMINNSACGIITSVFLKNLNSILKTFASALELVFTAVLCWIIFGISIDIYTVAAIAIVSFATFLYAQNPVVNKGKLDINEKSDNTKLIKVETMT